MVQIAKFRYLAIDENYNVYGFNGEEKASALLASDDGNPYIDIIDCQEGKSLMYVEGEDEEIEDISDEIET